ncbi:HAD-like domain-containing protein [Baffinella frigidus]|nr:HAD-like domain-containing protein [Cryptophyta sp. CCMP2293]
MKSQILATILAIDKTGTLTEGAFRINELRAFSESLSEAELFQLLLTAQQQSAHPMAVAVCASAQKRGIVAIPGGASCEVVKGEGIRATIKGRVVEVGNRRMLNRILPATETELLIEGGNRRMLNRILPAAPVPEADAAREWEANGATVSWVFVDGVAAAIFSAVDKPRPEAAEAVTKLGVRTLMLTGDNTS